MDLIKRLLYDLTVACSPNDDYISKSLQNPTLSAASD